MFEGQVAHLATFLRRVVQLNAQYRTGGLQTYVPEALRDSQRPLEELIGELLPASHAALKGASRSLFFSLPVAFDPAEAVGPYLASVDRDAGGRSYRFLDMGALIATSAFGENDPYLARGAQLETIVGSTGVRTIAAGLQIYRRVSTGNRGTRRISRAP